MAPRRKRKAAAESIAPRSFKNPRIEKRCGSCDAVTTHSVRTNGKIFCLVCQRKRVKEYRNKYAHQLSTMSCPKHPKNTHRATSGEHCACCFQARMLVTYMRKEDKARGRICDDSSGPVTVEFLNTLEGMPCNVCGESCHIIYDPAVASNSSCLSLGRIGTGRAHDCNLEHNIPQHLICNRAIHSLTMDEFLNRVKIAGDNDCRIEPSLSDAVLSFGVAASLIARKKAHAKRRGTAFDDSTYTAEWLKKQYEVTQKGRCVGCTAPLLEDVTFDRIDSTHHYVLVNGKSNVQLMHSGCNCGKGEEPIEVLHEMFRRAYAFHFPAEAAAKACE